MTSLAVILGLDVSPRRIGAALVDYETGTAIRAETHGVDRDDDLRARRTAFRNIAQDAETESDVCLVILEDAYSGPNRRGTIIHALAIGNVEAFAQTRWPDILVARISPATWRGLIGIKEGKDAVRAWAGARLDSDVDQDAADALAIATAGYELTRTGGGDETSDANSRVSNPPERKETKG